MTVTSATQAVPKVPVVDFSKEDCLKPGTTSWVSVRGEVCRALEEFSCFNAVMPNKVSPELHDSMFRTLKELFDFPVEIKEQIPGEKPLRYGYVGTYVHESLDPCIDTEGLREFEHHFWPNGNEKYRESAGQYARAMVELNQVVTRMVFEYYNVEKYLDDHLQSIVSNLRYLRYNEPKDLGGPMDLPVHTDKGFTTILHQNHVNGLKINTKDDKWIDFNPLPSSFIFMASDAFQVWSNDRIRACKHRVILKENHVRYSFALFSFNHGITPVPKELIDEDHPIKYKAPFNMLEYLQYFMDNMANVGVGYSVKEYCGV